PCSNVRYFDSQPITTRGHAMVMGLVTQRRNSSDPFAAYPLSVGPSVGYEIQEFLAWEALLLDNRRYAEWTALLAKNLAYCCPGRRDEERSHHFILCHLIARPAVPRETSAHTHRFLSNVIVSHGDCAEEFAVASYVLVHYSNPGESDTKVFTVDRRDRLRRTS